MKLKFCFHFRISGLRRPYVDVTHAVTGTTDLRIQRCRWLRPSCDPRGLLSLASLAAFVRQPQRKVEARVLDRQSSRLETNRRTATRTAPLAIPSRPPPYRTLRTRLSPP